MTFVATIKVIKRAKKANPELRQLSLHYTSGKKRATFAIFCYFVRTA
jgi:hypothetical protein